MLPVEHQTLEDRVKKLECEVGIVRRRSHVRQSLHATHVICSNRDRDRLNTAFMIAEGAVAIGQEVNIFLDVFVPGISKKPDGWPAKAKSWIDRLLGLIWPFSGARGSRWKGISGKGWRVVPAARGHGTALRELKALVAEARERGIRVYECGLFSRSGGLDPECFGDPGLADWCSIPAMVSMISKGGTTLFV